MKNLVDKQCVLMATSFSNKQSVQKGIELSVTSQCEFLYFTHFNLYQYSSEYVII